MQDPKQPPRDDAAPSAAPQRRSRRGLAWLVLALAAIVTVIAWHALHRKPHAHGAPVQVVGVATATIGSMPVTLSALGTVTPTATVTVLPQLSGYLTEVGFREGQDVAKGQFLAQIDPRQYQIGKQQAQAQLDKDMASLGQARADLARYAALHAKHAIADQTYIDQTFLVQQDEAAVKADQASIAQYELDLSYCRITAPVAGRVGLRLVDPGNYVTASSSPGIAVITTMKPTTVEFGVAQNQLAEVLQRFNSGAKLPVAIYDSDNTRQIASGMLYAISNQMATATGTVTLRASVPNADEALFPNEFVNVQLLVDTLHDAVLVPTPALQSGAPGNYVFVVKPDDTVALRKVVPGPSNGQETVITSGLAAGERVVTDGLDRLSDGSKIRPAAPRGSQPAGTASAPRRHGKGSHAASRPA